MRKKTKWMATALAVLLFFGILAAFQFSKSKKNESGPSSAQTTAANPDAKNAPTPDKQPAPLPEEKTDIVLIGSEMEGMYLARAAKDEGLSVKVLDPREQPGGQLLQAEMLFLDETRDEQGRLLVQGRAKELFDGFRSAKIRKLPEFTAYFEKLGQDIPIESGIQIDTVTAAPGANGTEALQSLTYKTKDGTLKKITASYWVDNSDFTALASKLKVTRLPGLEKFYGQDKIEYMSAGMMMKFKNVDWANFQKNAGGSVNGSFAIGLSGVTGTYKPTNDRVFLRGLNAVNQRDGEVLINAFLLYTIDPSDNRSVAEGLELGKKEIPLILAHFRKNFPGWERAELNGFPDYLYIREYNHYETDYTLQVSDMLGGRVFYDNVSMAGYPLDLQGTSANKWGIEMGRPDKYGMPLRSFLLKNYENVILAGKNVGSSAIAYGSARIQPNTALAAESIGVILGQIQGKKKLRDLQQADWPQLHQYLDSKYGIKLTGVQGRNKITGWTPDEIAKLDSGEIQYPTYSARRGGAKPPSAPPSQPTTAKPKESAKPAGAKQAPAAPANKQG